MNNAGVFIRGENAPSYETYVQGFGVDVMWKKKPTTLIYYTFWFAGCLWWETKIHLFLEA